jgi:uncharacterized protein (TIGR03086 family)
MTTPSPSVEQLTRALAVAGRLIAEIQDDQWAAPTPCSDWTVRELVEHLVVINQVFAALMNDQTPPDRATDPLGDDPAGMYRDSGVAVRAAFDQPGILEQTYQGPLGPVTGAVRLHWRITDLLTHSWDLSQAIGQPAESPADLAEQALAFVRTELATQPRAERFAPAQSVDDDAPAIDRLAAFLGRPVRTAR